MNLLLNLNAYGQAQSQELTSEFVKVTRDAHGTETDETITYSAFNPRILPDKT